MKNKILTKLLIIFLNLFFVNLVLAQNIEFKATEIEFFQNQNLTIANNGIAIIKEDKISAEGTEIKYFKDKSLLLIKEGKIFKTDQNIEISSQTIEYRIDKSNLTLKKNVKINDKNNNLFIDSNEINYDVVNKLISSKTNSKIIDNLGNIYKVKEFEYSLEKKVIKLNQLVAFDANKNSFIVDLAYMDLAKKELTAKDVNLNFKISENSENEPRLKGRSLIDNENNTIVKKSTFTFCKKREKCPPWELSAEEIRHDKKKKTINYKNATLKIYDRKIFYFPKFFHPDPTVKRQTGFLVPRLQDNSTSGLSLNLPYFFAIAENKDITISPRLFFNDKFLLQSEFRQKNKKSFHIADISQYISNNNNSKGHLFYDFSKRYNSENFSEIDLNIELQQVTDETYLKALKIESPIINNKSKLKNFLSLDLYNDKQSINTSFDIYEDLSKADSDKFEYVPNFSFSNIINNNFSFDSLGYYKNYNTNIKEKVLINNFNFQSIPKYFNNGVVNEKKFLLKNVNTKAKNSENFENDISNTLLPTIQSTYTFPLVKETKKFDNTLTPKLSLKLSPDYTRDIRDRNEGRIDYFNIYDLDRLGIEVANEGGISATYGYEYTKLDKSIFAQKMKFGFANNLRLSENKDLPSHTNLGDKVSDFVGLFEYSSKDNFKLDYNFSLKDNLVEKNYELFGFEFYLRNLTSTFEYRNENNSELKDSYVQNETRFNFDNNNSLIFKTRENKEKSFTEFYNIMYQYQNDCLTAGIEYNKEYYTDQDLKPSENLFFKISILPFGGFNTPNLK
ncbi:hypothetical protein OA862_00655 [Candidatus Pelagibacter sp.]|nr:hypothetical protein [Candidatus Pelagibacter sp.]